jgi:hypothetical protein
MLAVRTNLQELVIGCDELVHEVALERIGSKPEAERHTLVSLSLT